jgi:hypothetical protein
MWYCRSRPNMLRAWATLCGCVENELIVSYDGMSLFRPWTVEESWRSVGPWYHTDMSPDLFRQGKYLHVQGFVTLLDTSELTGGNVVVPRSVRCSSCTPCWATVRLLCLASF